MKDMSREIKVAKLIKKGKLKGDRGKHMNPAAESWFIKAFFSVALAMVMLIFAPQLISLIEWVFGEGVWESPITTPALIILFGGISIMGGFWLAYRTSAGSWLRSKI